MIQLNLLPDVKATYVKAQRTKRTAITLSVIISAVSIGVVALLASVALGAQQITLNNVQNDIDAITKEIQSEEDLDKILTIQNQLNSVGGLHDSKPVATRLFKYLQQTTPVEVKMDTFNIDLEGSTLTISGNAPSIEIINKYVDTLKFTELKDGEAKEGEEDIELPRAFSEVVLTDFETSPLESTYEISLKFDERLFNSQNPNIQLLVPKITTTRSQTEAPDGALFKQNTLQSEEEN